MKRRQAKNPREQIIRQTKATSVRQEKEEVRQGLKHRATNQNRQAPSSVKDFVGMDIDLMNYTDI